jgi:hypothetical protein
LNYTPVREYAEGEAGVYDIAGGGVRRLVGQIGSVKLF